MSRIKLGQRGVRLKAFAAYGFLTLLWIGILCAAIGVTVHALGNTAPDKADFDTFHAYYTLSNTKDVAQSGSMGVTVYKQGAKPTGPVTLHIDFSGDGGKQGGNQNSQGEGSMQWYVCPGNVPRCAGLPVNPAPNPPRGGAGQDTITLPAGKWTADGTNGYAEHVQFFLNPGNRSLGDDSNHINFRLSINGSNYYIGPDGGFNIGIVQNEYCYNNKTGRSCANTHQYTIPFAPNCNQDPGNDQYVNIHDMDEGVPYIQPQNLTVRIWDTTANKIVNDNHQSGGTGRGSGQDAQFHFNPVKDHKYKLVLDNVNGNNVLQLSLPFDSPNAVVSCTPPDSPPTGTLNLSCNPDGTGTIDFSFSDPDGNTKADLTINYANKPNGTQTFGKSGSHTVKLTDAEVAGTWGAKLHIYDNGGNNDNWIPNSGFRTHTSCAWSLTNTAKRAAGQPGNVMPGGKASFDFGTQNNSGVMKTDGFDYWNSYTYKDQYGKVVGWTKIDTRISNGLPPNGKTTLIPSWTTTIPADTTYAQLCVERITSVTSSSDKSNLPSNQACVSIVTPSCPGVDISPLAVEPNGKFSVQATIDLGTPAIVASVLSKPSNHVFMQINGPQVSDTNPGPSFANFPDIKSNPANNPYYATAGSKVIEYANNLGPTNNTGIYTVQYGIRGPVDPVNCVRTFTIGYLPYFNVRGDMAIGTVNEATSTGNNCVSDDTAGVQSWNYDNDAANGHPGYYGAGSSAAIYALKLIADFATGQNPGANASPLAGRSVAGSLQATKAGPTPHDYGFANTGSGVPVADNLGQFGGSFANVACPHNYVADIPSGSSTWTDDYGHSGTYVIGHDQTISGGTLSDVANKGYGPVINLVVKGDVYIQSDIKYDLSGLVPGKYPQFTLIATGNIYIDGNNVTELHGKYIAQQGSIITCSTGLGVETTAYGTCNSPLTIYGAALAKNFHLDRTYGSLTSTSGPAEDFVYTPELWLSTPDCLANPTDYECNSSASPTFSAVTSLPPVL